MKRREKHFFYNWPVKILCFVVAVAVYIVISSGVQQKRTVKLKLDVIMPEGYVATSIVPDSADIVINGSEEIIYMLNISDFSLSADFSGVDREGVSSVPVKIDAGNLASYIDLRNVSIHADPSYVRVYFEKEQ